MGTMKDAVHESEYAASESRESAVLSPGVAQPWSHSALESLSPGVTQPWRAA